MEASFGKLTALQNYLRGLGSVAVAFSGGVDSTFLLKVAHDVLGDKAIAVTAVSNLVPRFELDESFEFCRREKIRQVTYDFDPFAIKGFDRNPPDRCYICKYALFTSFKKLVDLAGILYLVEGSNLDDVSDFRPGMKAIEELGVCSPLLVVGLRKSEIRALSELMNLSTASKPSMACLATRFAHGELITVERLAMVERAEEFLRSAGFGQFRVRVHGDLARIEVDSSDFFRIVQPSFCNFIVNSFTSFGFRFVTLDLQGYRVGSMNFIHSSLSLK